MKTLVISTILSLFRILIATTQEQDNLQRMTKCKSPLNFCKQI